jgi:hypothetical protein
MNSQDPQPVVSPLRARANRLRWWWRQQLGWPAALGIVLLIGAAWLLLVVRPGYDSALQSLLRAHVATLDSASRGPVAVSSARSRDPRDAVRDSWPSVSARGESIAQLVKLLEREGVVADRAEYTTEDQEPGLARLRVTVPVEGRYADLRALIAALLNGLPHAALDGVQLERQEDGASRLSGTLRLSLFFRKEAP